MNLEVFEQSFSSNSRQSSKDPYSLRSEMDSLIFLLQIFQQNRSAHIPLSTYDFGLTSYNQQATF